MDFEKFLSDLKTPEKFSDYQKSVAEKIKNHNLPVIVFGAAILAEKVTATLKKFGVEVSGYAVDEKYFKPNKFFLDLPIYNFDELSKTPEKYVFVLGVGLTDRGLQRKNNLLANKKIVAYDLDVLVKLFTIDKHYISDHRENFIETYNLLADDFSKKTMLAYLKTHLTNNLQDISKVVVPNQYFNDLTRPAIQGGA